MDLTSLFRAAETDPAKLRILIAATPKTGNIWLKNLLAIAYDLPQVEFPFETTAESVSALGETWVAHQHLLPSLEVLETLDKLDVLVVTIVRHPGDVLVSLRHFVPPSSDGAPHDAMAIAMQKDGDGYAEHTLTYVRHHFAAQLNLSLMWMRLGAHVLHYERLLSDPLGTLGTLSRMLPPIPPWRIRAAVVLSDFKRMKRRNLDKPGHFRRGISGEWAAALPPAVIDVFRTQEPYPSQFEALGYTLDARASQITPFDAGQIDPFLRAGAFDNGVPISDFIVEAYLAASEGNPAHWPNPCLTGSARSFFGWLNEPAEQDPRPDDRLRVTNLALAIYQSRSDLQRLFPEVFGADRIGFLQWYLSSGLVEYDLDPAFAVPVLAAMAGAPSERQDGSTAPACLASTARWLTAPSADDPYAETSNLIITNLAHSIYRLRPDLQSAFPDLFGRHRLAYVQWFLTYGRVEYNLDIALTAPVMEAIARGPALTVPHLSLGPS